jgi:hypothetical protein
MMTRKRFVTIMLTISAISLALAAKGEIKSIGSGGIIRPGGRPNFG